VRLCIDQVEAMGGRSSRNYALFQALAVEIFLCLRRHAGVIYTKLNRILVPRGMREGQSAAAGVWRDRIKQHFNERCGYEEVAATTGGPPHFAQEKAAKAAFEKILHSAMESNNFLVLDRLHTGAKAAGFSGASAYIADGLAAIYSGGGASSDAGGGD
jgi:hypothetical protein